ncbi:MAG: hypothetical protein LBR67_00040 [Dysgonamonadaceae bacterium]|jgi:hypothetical protein|nr:hypothetical protein [Dysgonamonadaceae bacterium]
MSQRNNGNIPQHYSARYLFESVMAVFYVALSALLLFTNVFDTIQGNVRLWVGVVLGLYGLFRIYRALKKLFQKEETTE